MTADQRQPGTRRPETPDAIFKALDIPDSHREMIVNAIETTVVPAILKQAALKRVEDLPRNLVGFVNDSLDQDHKVGVPIQQDQQRRLNTAIFGLATATIERFWQGSFGNNGDPELQKNLRALKERLHRNPETVLIRVARHWNVNLADIIRVEKNQVPPAHIPRSDNIRQNSAASTTPSTARLDSLEQNGQQSVVEKPTAKAVESDGEVRTSPGIPSRADVFAKRAAQVTERLQLQSVKQPPTPAAPAQAPTKETQEKKQEVAQKEETMSPEATRLATLITQRCLHLLVSKVLSGGISALPDDPINFVNSHLPEGESVGKLLANTPIAFRRVAVRDLILKCLSEVKTGKGRFGYNPRVQPLFKLMEERRQSPDRIEYDIRFHFKTSNR
jgi:hypothetical protein